MSECDNVEIKNEDVMDMIADKRKEEYDQAVNNLLSLTVEVENIGVEELSAGSFIYLPDEHRWFYVDEIDVFINDEGDTEVHCYSESFLSDEPGGLVSCELVFYSYQRVIRRDRDEPYSYRGQVDRLVMESDRAGGEET